MVRVETRSDVGPGVVLVTLDRPERRNAVDHPTLLALIDAQQQAADARVVVVTGAPPAFSAGADLNGVDQGVFATDLARMLAGFVALDAAVIAAVDGPALGAGTQITAVCDLRIATPTSMFGIPAARLGIAVDHWTVDRIRGQFGDPIARAMLLAAETFTGERLHQAGAVHRLGGLDDALAWASEIALLAPMTIGAHKLALETPFDPDVADTAVDAAREAAWASADAIEGRSAFLEKRRADFHGH